MPFQSDRQRRFIYAKAGEGVPWAEKFVRDAGNSSGMASYSRLASKMVSGGTRAGGGGGGLLGIRRGRGGSRFKPRSSGGTRFRNRGGSRGGTGYR